MTTKTRNGALLLAATLALSGAASARADKPHKDNGNHGNKHGDQDKRRKDDDQGDGEASRAARLSEARQQELIEAQRRRGTEYAQRLEQQERKIQERAEPLRTGGRSSQYRYQQQYLEQLRQQRAAVTRSYDYGADPYYSTAPTFRYVRDGRTYQVNRYAADMLRQAANHGYEQGVRAGQADREDRWSRGRYQDSLAYDDATYGWNGAYVEVGEYRYYFRQGFQRGYQDGMSRRFQYGVTSNGHFSLLSGVVNAIISIR